MKRVAIGGFQHETNTFSDKPADFQAFVEADGWPGLARGKAMIQNLKGYNIGVTGLIDGSINEGWEIVPLTWAYGGAGGKVTGDAFERICGMLLEDLANAGPLDGILLDLHGAMVSEVYDDGEGELLRRVRDQVGMAIPLVACFDLHANITDAMVTLTDRLVGYRTYPHLDMAETGARAAIELSNIFEGKIGKARVFRQLPFLIPLTVGCTLHGPVKWIYERVRDLETLPGIDHVSFACGFNPSDVPHCGPSLLVYGQDQKTINGVADAFLSEVLARESEFIAQYWDAASAVTHAIKHAANQKGPIILADIQDNYGGGSYSDTNWILRELVAQDAKNAGLGVLCDSEAAAIAHRAGVGAEITIGLGAKSGLDGHEPFHAIFRVEALSDGNIQSIGEYFAGGMMQLGPMAMLAVGGTRIIVSSRAEQAADQAMFTHFGLDPASLDILVLKSTVHYRADFQDIASDVLEVVAPAPMPVDSSQLDYKNLRPGLRVVPKGDPISLQEQ
ncbi:MAG: M81 family metallopeptidase [Pseudomonadota bacterium]